MAAGTITHPAYCAICDRDAWAIPAEVRVFVDDICCECWIASVPDIHAVDDIPRWLQPLVPRALWVPA